MSGDDSGWSELESLVLSHEDWLMDRILAFARRRGYTKYTSTLAEAWRLSVSGLSAALVAFLRSPEGVPEMGPDDRWATHPAAAFGVLEAERHRARGITLGMFLGLMKYYRDAYCDLVASAGWGLSEERRALRAVQRFFDVNELGFGIAWTAPSHAEGLAELQETARRATNEKNQFLTLFESLSSPAFLLGPDGCVRGRNEAAQALVPAPGYYSGGEPGARLGLVDEELRTLLRGEAATLEVERRLDTVAGPRDFTVRLKRMLDVSGKFEGVVVLMSDVTELKRSAEELRRARDAAEAAARARSAFLASVSHEIRTPLNAIIGFSELLSLDPELSPRQAANAATMRSAGQHLLALIDNVLDAAKVDAGRMSVEPGPVDLPALLGQLWALFRFRAAEKGLELTFTGIERLPRSVETDGRKLRQVLLNLLGNAVKFTARGSVVLRAACREEDPAAFLELEVEDTGPGIAPAEQEAVFGAFEQASAGRKAREGTGLGLSLSRQFARMMGGDVTVRSVPGEGSTFRVAVPVQLLEAPPEGSPGRGRVIGLAPGSRRPRVLVVDDREANRTLLRQMLEPVGFLVTEAVDGAEAVEAVERELPDAVLMDVVMPVLDGREAARRLHERHPELPVIGVSSDVLPEDADEVFRSGANGFLQKPVLPDLVLAELAGPLGLDYVLEGPDRALPRSAPSGTDRVPPELLRRLLAAAEALDGRALGACLPALEEADPALAAWVREKGAAYLYDDILATLGETREVTA